MSYEGYVQYICESGHYYTGPALYGEPNESVCQCGKTAAWSNDVDDTNCDEYGIVPVAVLRESLLISEAQTQTCNLGHSHTVKEEVWRVPTPEETKGWRCYRHVETYHKIRG